MTIRSRLFISFCITFIIFSLLLAFQHWASRNENRLVKIDAWNHFEVVTLLSIQSSLNQYAKVFRDIIFDGSADSVELTTIRRNVHKELRRLLDVVEEEIVFHEKEGNLRRTMVEREEKARILSFMAEYSRLDMELDELLAGEMAAARRHPREKIEEVERRFNEKLVSVIRDWGREERREMEIFKSDFARLIRGNNILVTTLVFVAVSITFIIFYSLIRTIGRGLESLLEGTKCIAEGEQDFRFREEGGNECAWLGAAFNTMIEQRAAAQKKLIEQSYYSGVAEMSSGVLHNVRNAMSPLVLLLDNLIEDVGKLDMARISAAQEELYFQSPEENRRQDLKEFLTLAIEVQGKKMEAMMLSLEKLRSIVASVENILASQSRHVASERPLETFLLADLLRDAVGLVSQNLLREVRITFDPSINDAGKVRTHRVILLQVFTNLFQNAADSIKRSGRRDGEIVVTAEPSQTRIHLVVHDNGEGIAPKEMGRIFTLGYSTKKFGGSGFGLHWSANSISALKGVLYAESDGEGRGARFHLEIERNLLS